MKIKQLHIENVGGIQSLIIDFNQQLNLICGPNGVGKTTILEAIAHTFTFQNTDILKKRAGSDFGQISATVVSDGQERQGKFQIEYFEPSKSSNIQSKFRDFAKSLLSFKVQRIFSYQLLKNVERDVVKSEPEIWREAQNGIKLVEVKSWLVNRLLFSLHEGSYTSTQLHNLSLAKRCFSLIDPKISFSGIKPSTLDIMLNTPNGVIYYEYLSSGFKACLSIILGIIKEVEFRFAEEGIKADEFDGIILIDEIEVHLHPAWQARIGKILTDVFPRAQFIATTHSPHVLQHANPDQIIPLADDGGVVYRREVPATKYGYQGWTIEEILTEVMGMTDTRTAILRDTMEAFTEAINKQDAVSANEIYKELESMLFPGTPVTKILRLQLANIGVVGD